MQKGITIAGNITYDLNHYIKTYPVEGALTSIYDLNISFGGCVTNTAVNLSLIENNQNIHVSGNIGFDAPGIEVINFLNSYGLNTKGIKKIKNQKTATVHTFINTTNFTRTFFVDMGVSNIFGRDIIECETEYFHIGYLLLLPYLDEIVNGNETRMSQLLKRLQDKGIKTSIDVVTSEEKDYVKIITPSLPYVNYLIINEIEASRIANVEIFDDYGNLVIEKLKKVAERLKEFGVKDKIIIHAPSLGLIYDGHKFEIVKSLKLPKEFIKSSVGAGDGFCAGALYGIMNQYSDKDILRLSSCVAAAVLNSNLPQSKIVGLDAIMNLENKFGR